MERKIHMLLVRHANSSTCWSICIDVVFVFLCIVGFKPHASMEKAHHILIYGCTEPGDAKNVWYVRWHYSYPVQLSLAVPLWVGAMSAIIFGKRTVPPWTITPQTFPLPCSVRVRVRSGVSRVRLMVGVRSVGWKLGLVGLVLRLGLELGLGLWFGLGENVRRGNIQGGMSDTRSRSPLGKKQKVLVNALLWGLLARPI